MKSLGWFSALLMLSSLPWCRIFFSEETVASHILAIAFKLKLCISKYPMILSLMGEPF